MNWTKLAAGVLEVSELCLGSMTWGTQNTPQEGHDQIDRALEAGINFIDTAEMYSVPPRAETQGSTETIIGRWLSSRSCRDRVVLATKVAGPGGDWLTFIRGGDNHLDRSNILAAADASLRRLQTDVIDLYQLHWPERNTNFFGKLGFEPGEEEDLTPVAVTLSVLQEFVQAGKIRHIGLSNETPWGIMRFLQAAEQSGLPRVVSVQNPYSLLNRSYEVGAAEVFLGNHASVRDPRDGLTGLLKRPIELHGPWGRIHPGGPGRRRGQRHRPG